MILCIAIGNSLRGDDAVARRTQRLLARHDQVRLLEAFQLTPELACDMALADKVLFLDADPAAVEPMLVPIEALRGSASPFTHHVSPAELVAIARRLYGFAGKALLCRIPARRFGHGEALTTEAEAAARSAAKLIQGSLCGSAGFKNIRTQS